MGNDALMNFSVFLIQLQMGFQSRNGFAEEHFFFKDLKKEMTIFCKQVCPHTWWFWLNLSKDEIPNKIRDVRIMCSFWVKGTLKDELTKSLSETLCL